MPSQLYPNYHVIFIMINGDWGFVLSFCAFALNVRPNAVVSGHMKCRRGHWVDEGECIVN
jgi:hypothetical protein